MATKRTSTKTDPAADDKATDSKTPKTGVLCGDGCGQMTKPGRTFLQGHDAKLHGLMARALRNGETTIVVNGTEQDIAATYEQRGWKPAQPRKSRKADPATRVARLREQLAAAEAVLAEATTEDEAPAV